MAKILIFCFMATKISHGGFPTVSKTNIYTNVGILIYSQLLHTSASHASWLSALCKVLFVKKGFRRESISSIHILRATHFVFRWPTEVLKIVPYGRCQWHNCTAICVRVFVGFFKLAHIERHPRAQKPWPFTLLFKFTNLFFLRKVLHTLDIFRDGRKYILKKLKA